MVMSVRPSVRVSVRPSVTVSALFSYTLWHIDLKFCVSLYFYARKVKFDCHQFPSLFAGVMLLFNFKLLKICSFPHFSPTCFDILSSNFVYDFVLMYHRASLSVVILLQFLLELFLFVNLEYSKHTVLCTFLLHALTYWAQILHMTLFYCTTDQVGVSSICVYFGVMPLFELIILLIHFSALFSYTLWHIELKFCTLLFFTVLQVNFKCRQWVSIFVGVMILLGLRILEIHSFPHFSPAFFDILSWNFSYNFV